MTEHTPVPWEIRHRLNSVGAPNVGGRWVIAQMGTSKREDFFIAEMPFAAVRSADEKEHDANAAFIVKAVNSHDALVKALQGALVVLESMPRPTAGLVSNKLQATFYTIFAAINKGLGGVGGGVG